MKSELKRNFSVSYAELSAICKNSMYSMLRDIEEFEHYGINTQQVEDYRAEVENFDKLPVDENYRGQITEAVINKEEAGEVLRHEIRVLKSHLLRIYSLKDPIFTRMRIKELSKQSDYQLVRTGEAVLYELQKVQPELEGFGFSAEIIVNLKTVFNNFAQKVLTKDSLVQDRDEITEIRVETANSDMFCKSVLAFSRASSFIRFTFDIKRGSFFHSQIVCTLISKSLAISLLDQP